MIIEKSCFVCSKSVIWSYMYQIFYVISKTFLLCEHQGHRRISTVLLSSLFMHHRNTHLHMCFTIFSVCPMVYHEDYFKDNHPLLFAEHYAQCRCNTITVQKVMAWSCKKIKCFSLRMGITLQIPTGLPVKWCASWNMYPCQQKCFVWIELY